MLPHAPFAHPPDALTALWSASAILAIASVAVMAGLVLYRAACLRKEERQKNRRLILKQYFFTGIASPVEPEKGTLPPLSNEDADLIGDVALEILRPLQGDAANRVIRMLELWNYPHILLRQIKTGKRAIKVHVLTLLALFDRPETFDALLKHIENKDPYVQLAAMRGVALRGKDPFAGAIVNSIENTKMETSLFLADVLALFHEEALPVIHKLAQHDKSARVRLAATRAIGFIGSLSSVDMLLRLLSSDNTSLKREALDALGRIGDIRAAETMVACLDDKDLDVRLKATQALGKMRYLPAIPAFAKGLTSPDWWLRYRSAEALYSISDGGNAVLRSMASQPDLAGLICLQYLAEKEQT